MAEQNKLQKKEKQKGWKKMWSRLKKLDKEYKDIKEHNKKDQKKIKNYS